MIAVVVSDPTAVAACAARANVTATIGVIVAEPSPLGYRREDARPPDHLLLAGLGGGGHGRGSGSRSPASGARVRAGAAHAGTISELTSIMKSYTVLIVARLISIRNVTKVYRSGTTEVAALRGVSLEVNRGEFLAIAGPSGSGKSTLLNLIGCLDAATAGEVLIDDQAVSGMNRKQLALFRRNHLGFVFQSFNLIPVLTAYENVSLALSLLTLDAREVRTRSLQMLGEVGLEDMPGRRPGELSGGQQQRVAIARALVKEPQIVLADEPTANVDSEIGEGLLELMRRLNRQLGSTFIFSTHDAMVMDYADRLVRLQDGRIVSDEHRAGAE